MKPLDYILLAVFSGALLIVGSFLTSEQSADRLRRSGFHAAKRSAWAAAAERALGQRQPCLESLAGGPGAPARPPTLSEGGGARRSPQGKGGIRQKLPWTEIRLHHSGSAAGNLESLEQLHRQKLGIPEGSAYHFVIGNGTLSGDGEIEVSARWRQSRPGGARPEAVEICLVGRLDDEEPTASQVEAVQELLSALLDELELAPSAVRPHRTGQAGVPARQAGVPAGLSGTMCPGSKFPFSQVLRQLEVRREVRRLPDCVAEKLTR